MWVFLLVAHALAQPDWAFISKQRAAIMSRAQSESNEKMAREAGMAETFVGVSSLETSLIVLEQKKLMTGTTRMVPWTGHFWPNYQGGAAARWLDPLFPKTSWGLGERYVQVDAPWEKIPLDQLSPAEKYDLATGLAPEEENSVTTHQWNMGRMEYATTGAVATWQGICHGWAPASVYFPEPRHDVTVASPEGPILFTRDDIKALGALYWANSKFTTVYAGWRCNNAAPSEDAEGRILEPKCFDVNPGDWHLILSHLIGAGKEPFIMDIETGTQVWNKPVVEYEIEFFDLTNYKKTSKYFRKVLRERARLSNLRFGNYRSVMSTYVVGVRSTVVFHDGAPVGQSQPKRHSRTYTYDLELDADYRILGGEWRDEKFPDFLWRPDMGIHPSSEADKIMVDVNRMGSASWRKAAHLSSPKGIPLKAFVDYMFEQSSR